MCLVPSVRADCLDGVAAAGVVGCGCDLRSAPGDKTRNFFWQNHSLYQKGSNRFHNKVLVQELPKMLQQLKKYKNY